jgi:hypothetical protein
VGLVLRGRSGEDTSVKQLLVASTLLLGVCGSLFAAPLEAGSGDTINTVLIGAGLLLTATLARFGGRIRG